MRKTTIRNNLIVNQIREIYYYMKNNKYSNFKNIHSIQKNSIILVSHDGNKQGAEVLLLYIAKWYYEHNIPLVIISRKHGMIISDFTKYGYITVINRKSKIEKFIKKLNNDFDCRYVLLNTIVNGDLTEVFSRNNFKIITAIHELDNTIIQFGLSKNLHSATQYSDYIIFPSQFVKQRIEDNIMKISCQTVCKPQGLFLINESIPADQAKEQLKHRYPQIIQNDSIIVLGVGFASERKGTDIFFNMAYESYKRHDNHIFVWIGQNVDKFYEKIRSEKNIENLPNLILPGYIDDANEINIYYHACDIFCLTSREEPFGSVILEAFHAHKPIVAFEKSGGYTDFVINNETGLLAKQYDFIDMYNQLLKLNDLNKREELGNNGFEKTKTLSFDNYCKTFLDLFGYPSIPQ